MKALHDQGIPELPWNEIKTRCTMLSSTGILKIKTKQGYKWPKLEECIKFFFDEQLEGAHDALTDVRACIRVYKELEKLKAFKD